MKILIVKMSAIGDVVHTLPALCALRRAHAAAHIAWLVEEEAAEVLRGHRALDRLIVSRRRSWLRDVRRGRFTSAWRDARRFLGELRDTRYDLLIDFQGLLKSSVWVGLAAAGRKAGFGRGMQRSEGSWLFLNERVPAVDMDVHALERGLRLLEALGVPRGPVVYDFPIAEANDREALDILGGPGGGAAQPFVAIHPMARWPTKLWPGPAFAEVADRLTAEGFRVVLTGTSGDREALDAMAQRMAHEPIRADGRTPLRTLAALYRRAAVVLSTDTGPMHVAVAVGTPVVALFGPTAPWRTGPHGEGHEVMHAGLSCSPCYDRRCRTRAYEPHACMGRIGPKEVVAAVLRRAAGRGRVVPLSIGGGSSACRSPEVDANFPQSTN